MSTPSHSVDASKQYTFWTILAIFIGSVEVLLALWLAQADGAGERIVAGCLMVILLGGFLGIAYYAFLHQTTQATAATALPGALRLKTVPATTEEIINPGEKRLVGPDKTYTILKPPPDWVQRETPYSDLSLDNQSITDPAIRQQLTAMARQLNPFATNLCLSFTSKRKTSVIPVPGQTLIDGRKLPSALEFTIPTQLCVMPMERYQPPLFFERSFSHNVISMLAQLLAPGVVGLKEFDKISTDHGRQHVVVAQLRQEVHNAIVNGVPGSRVTTNIDVIGRQGEVHDHLLIMTYPSLHKGESAETRNDLHTLRNLANSFKPHELVDPEAYRKEIRAKADQEFSERMTKLGQDSFQAEFGVLVLRMKSWQLDDLQQLTRAVQLLKPFATFAKLAEASNEELDSLWDAVEQAGKGDFGPLKAQLLKAQSELHERLSGPHVGREAERLEQLQETPPEP